MQEQQNAIVETWWAATSQREFVDWLDEYGRAKDSNYAQARPMNMEWGMAWYHYVPGSSGGSIYFVVNTEAPATFGAGLLRITATLFTGYDEDTGKPVFSGSPGSVAYFQGLRESIERRFPAQNTPGDDWEDDGETGQNNAPAGQPMHEENKWLIEQHFEYGRPQHELREEWLERRQAAGRAEPANPGDSMRRVISDEKKRRKELESK